MQQSAPRRRVAAFYALTILLSLGLALVVVEVVLRHSEYTVAAYVGHKAQDRWYRHHWRPLNEVMQRDFPLAARLNAPLPRLYFLGDSFTAGPGVDFEQTFYYRSAWEPGLGYNPFNLSRNGASTRSELADLQRFNALTGGRAAQVVHQYFINDIEDHVALPAWTPPAWQKWLAERLETAEFLLVWQFHRDWLGRYKDAMERAWQDPAVREAHLRDVARLHRAIRQQGGKVVFLLFPALSPEALTLRSAPLLAQVREAFARSCEPGDVLVDATAAAESLPVRRRVVNFLDPHPSAELHGLVAELVKRAVLRVPPAPGEAPAWQGCADLRRALAARAP